jgi:decaprenylphospho-beta-D-erythro-pentofuranosid-2-ulose 2-reductase
MSKGTVLILGARSDIARAIAHRFAKDGYALQLAARNIVRLTEDKTDLELRYSVPVSLHEFDALAIETHAEFVRTLSVMPDIAVCSVGFMGEQKQSEQDVKAAALVMRSNYEGPASIMSELANRFEERGSGTLVGISSVAGERGRATNYVYGSAKAGFTTVLSGMRNRLFKRGVHVVTILPGFVATRMTEGCDLPKMFTAQPSEVADAVARGIERKKEIVYVRGIWRVIMTIIRNMPEKLFKRTEL